MMPTPPFSPETPTKIGFTESTSNAPAPFLRRSADRFRLFMDISEKAVTDMDRLRSFASFIVTESQLWRNHYSNSFNAINEELQIATANIWEHSETDWHSGPPTARRVEEWREMPVSVDAKHEPDLSTVTNLDMSTMLDDFDARGRPSSRWWESSSNGGSLSSSLRVSRSSRESRHVSVPRTGTLPADPPRTLETIFSPAPFEQQRFLEFWPGRLNASSDDNTPVPTPRTGYMASSMNSVIDAAIVEALPDLVPAPAQQAGEHSAFDYNGPDIMKPLIVQDSATNTAESTTKHGQHISKFPGAINQVSTVDEKISFERKESASTSTQDLSQPGKQILHKIDASTDASFEAPTSFSKLPETPNTPLVHISVSNGEFNPANTAIAMSVNVASPQLIAIVPGGHSVMDTV